MEGSEFFQVEIEEGVARCTMNGPTMNAMGVDLVSAMIENLGGVLENDDARVIVIRGAGGNFSTGADLSLMGENMDPTDLCDVMRTMGSLLYQLHEGAKPVISEVDGWAVGGGFGLAMASDFTYATERARFFLSFIKLGIVPDFGSSYFLSRRVSLSLAKELALTGKIIGAEEAHRIGLVNRIVSHEEISDEVMNVAKKMAGRSPNTLALTKRFLNVGHTVDLKTFLDMEAHTQSITILTPEHRKAVEEFLKKMNR